MAFGAGHIAGASAEVFVSQAGGDAPPVPLLDMPVRETHADKRNNAGEISSYIANRTGGAGNREVNIARSVTYGDGNLVMQSQYGRDNRSDVGIFGGEANRVGVLQAGYSLQSKIGLVNTRGLNVLVLQPNGSAAVSMWALGLPNGAVMIGR